MLKTILILITIFASSTFATVISQQNQDLVYNILNYGKEGSLGLGYMFTLLQSKYFSTIFLVLVIAVPGVFLIHYLIIGAKKFSHDGKKYYIFNLFHRIIHGISAISFLILVPTGLIMIFGSTFNSTGIVKISQNLHAVATPVFLVSVIPMFLMWVKNMFFTTLDIKWMMILGGYLSKEKKPIPAGKFNAGQKMWFWVCTVGGIFMIFTGAFLYFQAVPASLLSLTGFTKIDFLRACVIAHNVLGMAVTALFFTHIYMSMFAIKGAIHSIINGYKEEEEIQILHSHFYKELKEKNKI